MRYVLLAAALAILALSGCSSIEELYTDVPKGVAIAQSTLATADHAALAYASLPICGKTSATLCKSLPIEAQIASAEQKAFDLVEAAHTAETQDALSAAQTALNALTTLTARADVQEAASTSTP